MPDQLDRRRFLGASALTGVSAALLGAGISGNESEEQSTGNGEDQSAESATRVIIGGVSLPASLDPGLAVDTETERICRQIFETLVGVDPDTGAASPLLAEEWEISDDELTYTFQLREGVTFHDGSTLTAETVVANFRRWGQLDYLYGFGNISRTTALAFPTVFGGYMDQDGCVLESVEAEDERTVVLTLSEPVVFLLQALTLPAFGIAASAALSDSDPGRLTRTPIGTGAYQLVSQEGGETRLQIFADYWNDATGAEEVVVRALPKSFDRLRELQRGRLDVYDCITADNLRPLVQAGRLILQRDPFSVLYLGFNLGHPVMSDPDIRQAAAHAVNRTPLVQNLFLEGSRPAFQFTPPALGVHSDSADRHGFDRAQARELLAESGYDGEPLVFYYPMATTRSYLPRPEAVFAALAADLTSVGFVIKPKPVVWDEGYVDQLLADDDRAMHLLGRNGGFRSPHSFFGPLFGQSGREFNYDTEEVRELLDQARAEPDDDQRADIYREVADLVAEDLPALPLAYPISALALGNRVADYPMSPVLNERFTDIVLAP